jgi:hypothetical protein
MVAIRKMSGRLKIGGFLLLSIGFVAALYKLGVVIFFL